MNPNLENLRQITRRHFLSRSACGVGAVALGSMLKQSLSAAETTSANPLAPRKPHFAAKARRVIYLHLTGSPPHLDLFD